MIIEEILNCSELTFVKPCRNSVCEIMQDGFHFHLKVERFSCVLEVHRQCCGEVKLINHTTESPI